MRGRTNWGNILDAPDDYAAETDLGFERPASVNDTYLAPQVKPDRGREVGN
jgi:hypothetical protein